jgi:hypothetical protein
MHLPGTERPHTARLAAALALPLAMTVALAGCGGGGAESSGGPPPPAPSPPPLTGIAGECQLVREKVFRSQLGSSEDIKVGVADLKRTQPMFKDPRIATGVKDFTKALDDLGNLREKVVNEAKKNKGKLSPDTRKRSKDAAARLNKARDTLRAACGFAAPPSGGSGLR